MRGIISYFIKRERLYRHSLQSTECCIGENLRQKFHLKIGWQKIGLQKNQVAKKSGGTLDVPHFWDKC